ncbi:hypothetical protein [uncultured Friedmanniella sp.]|uniref:hypothetical protein n=1 Tax=uncultured Friedmanniella sp. TaxID=335381 RepID=UPI0035CA2ECD
MITGVGGPAGAMLISAGADTIIQKATTGEVNWGEVGVSFAAGAVGGGFAAAKLGATGLRGAMVAGAVSGGVGGAATSGYQYASGPGPHTTAGFLGATAQGAGTGAVFGSLGGAASGVSAASGRALSDVGPRPLLGTRLSATDIRFSQTSVNGVKEIEASMLQHGWVGDPIDVVRMSDGGLTSVDNTRLLAAKSSGIDVQANVHDFHEPLPAEHVERFTTPKGGVPDTWGDAVTNRIGRQNSAYRDVYPNGSPLTGWGGDY